jgi:murein DD-endopeptidase MepM/ murein hydrolase activator NlpD
MGNKISLVVLDHKGSSIKQATVSKAFLNGIALFLGVLLLIGIWCACDYISLRKLVSEEWTSKADIQKAHAEITSQRKQIQEFATRIDSLKSQLASLNKFENKIRIIANLKNNTADQEGLFGVGGSLPEDLDPKLAVTDSHKRLISEMHEQINELSKAASGQEKRFKTLILKLENKRNILATTPSIAPVDGGWITSKFGYRISPFTNRREFHRGLDIAARAGTPIVATADGVVTFAGRKGLLGLCIIINHGHGLVTRYGHARKLLKKPGDQVKRGEEIAEVGSTGRSTGPHVHYEVFLNNVPINPKKYIMNEAIAKQ